jgi:hypothetical protein
VTASSGGRTLKWSPRGESTPTKTRSVAERFDYDYPAKEVSGALEKVDADTRRRAMQVLMTGHSRMKATAQMGRAMVNARLGRARRALRRRGAQASSSAERV